jgi:hypothetical protein
MVPGIIVWLALAAWGRLKDRVYPPDFRFSTRFYPSSGRFVPSTGVFGRQTGIYMLQTGSSGQSLPFAARMGEMV